MATVLSPADSVRVDLREVPGQAICTCVPPTEADIFRRPVAQSRVLRRNSRGGPSQFRSRLLTANDNDIDSVPRKGTVGFHVRRGDYLTHKQSPNLDYQTYLSAALVKLTEVTGQSDWRVSVYTDDPDWCRANLKLASVEINRDGIMLDDFLGLMLCQHKIVSNSTFAWWAAFLGEAEGGVVIAPKRWHATADSDEAQFVRKRWVGVND